MGNKCCHDKEKHRSDDADVHVIPSTSGFISATLSPVEKWEKKQKEHNAIVLERMREDFHNRPDNFLLNLLVVSLQFYRNYGKEKVDISNHIRDREQALDKKLTSSKRKIIYQGGFEEISGTHVLYQSKDEKYMELPSPLQIFIVQDNLEIYSDGQYDELQQRNYADLDGPSYRFCTEYSKRHNGYVRLRCADIIPGNSRSNTYEDIYAFMAPVDESKPDPVVDRRPLRRNSLISTAEDEDTIPSLPMYRPQLNSVSSIEEELAEEEEDDFDDEMVPPPVARMGRRPSGVMPLNYPGGNLLKGGSKKTKPLSNGFPGRMTNDKPQVPNLSERRPSGIFPKMSPNMDKLSISKSEKKMINNDTALLNLKKALDEIEEESEEEGEDEVDGENSGSKTISYSLMNTSAKVTEEESEDSEDSDTKVPESEPRLHAKMNSGVFVNRKLKIRIEGDAYGVKARSELRTYFSSDRYLDCFEEDFEDLMTIFGKPHLVDTSSMQMPAILANELMIKGIGPKFNTEFIPSVVMKEWPNCAFEWKLRERKPRTDEETKTIYRWPKPQSVYEVTKMGCNLVPIGHYDPLQPNEVMKIEWQIQFARAEQILLRSLGHTHIRLLLLVEFLMRDHLKDIPGLKTQHLRYILFWMCEHNFKDWQEERLGTKLKAYFKTLYNCLSTENLPHYFIDKCNMMETIPERYLRQIQALVRKMKDNLPIYLMHTMRRMRSEADFYPILDIKALYKLVTPKHYGMENINPALLTLAGGGDDNAQPEQFDDGEDVLYSDSDEEKEHTQMKEMLHRMRLAKERKENGGSFQQQKKRKASTINLRKTVQSVKDLRSGKLLTMFAKHFIQMARSSNEYRSYPQAYMYLLMAGNMATLLEETGHGDDAKDFRKEIDELNFASRGGVQDMLGSSWSISDNNYDIIPGNPTLRGSIRKESEPPPKPPNPSSSGTKNKSTKTRFQMDTKEKISEETSSPATETSEKTTTPKEYILSRDSETQDVNDSPPKEEFKFVIASDDEDFGTTNL